MAQMNGRVKSYEDADKYLGSKDSRPIAYNTRLERHLEQGGNISVRFHATIILQYYPDERMVLFSGGWRTSTTKDRLNDFIPAEWKIWQEKGVWFVYNFDCKSRYFFNEGIILYPEGWVGNAGADKTAENNLMIKRIKKYVSGYLTALLDGKVGEPGPGDCWGCYMTSDDGKDNPMGTDHLVSHLDESYFVPSLMFRAIDAFPVSRIAQWTIQGIWAKREIAEFEKTIMKEQVGKSLTRYLKSRILGIGV